MFFSSNKLLSASFACFCVPDFRLACVACGGNKCHWCNVAIVKIERFELNRYRGTPHKRSVESSCIGRLSACWGNPRREIAILRQGARGERCKTFSPCLPCVQSMVRIRPMRGSVSPLG